MIQELFKTERVKVAELVPNVKNPRKIKQAEKQKLWERIQKYGMIGIPVRDYDGVLLSGHQRCEILVIHGLGDFEIDVRTAVRKLTDDELAEVMIIENHHAGEFDMQKLQEEFSNFVDLDDFGISFEEMSSSIEQALKEDLKEPEMPIVPKYSEQYSAVVIVIENSIDENFIREVLGLCQVKDYKTENKGESFVTTAKQFIERWQAKI